MSSRESGFLSWMKRPWGLAITAGVLFGGMATVPWAKAAIKAAQSKDGFSVTAMKDEHEKDYEKKERDDKKAKMPGEVKAVCVADGGIYTAGKSGLFFQKDGKLNLIAECPVLDPKGMAKVDDTLVILDKHFIIVQKAGGAWEKSPSEVEAHALVVGGDGFLYAPGKHGVQRSKDGMKWEEIISSESLQRAAQG